MNPPLQKTVVDHDIRDINELLADIIYAVFRTCIDIFNSYSIDAFVKHTHQSQTDSQNSLAAGCSLRRSGQ